VMLSPHCICERGIFYRIIWNSKERIKHDERTTIIRQLVQQPGMQRAIPGLPARLVELIERFIVHQDEHDLVRNGVRAKTE